ncbi:chromosome partition protein MukE [Pasteurella multocida]|nr:chromosome partition protein MukE [Pasteurella multocida]
MTDNLQDLISTKLAAAIANPLFPAVDSQLRAGRHISLDQLDNHAFFNGFPRRIRQFLSSL